MIEKEKRIKKVEVETPEKKCCVYTSVKFQTCPVCGFDTFTTSKKCCNCGCCLCCD